MTTITDTVITIPVWRHFDPDWEIESPGDRRSRKICLYCLCFQHRVRYVSDAARTWLCRECFNSQFRIWRADNGNHREQSELEAWADAALDAALAPDDELDDIPFLPEFGTKPVREELSDIRRRRIFEFLRESGGATAEDVGRAVGYEWPMSAGYQLREMKKLGMVERDDSWPAVWRVRD